MTNHTNTNHEIAPRSRAIVLLLLAATAAILAWGLGETSAARPSPSASKLQVMGTVLDVDAVTPAAQLEAELQWASRSGALLGALLGAGMGAAGLRRDRPRTERWRIPAIGFVVGLALGAASPFLAHPLHELIRTPGAQELLPPIVMHAVQWGPLGLGAGLAFGLARGDRGPALAATVATAMIGAVVGSVIFDVIGSLAFPLDGPERIVATTPTARLVARLCVALGTAALLATMKPIASTTPASGAMPSSAP